MSTKTLTNLEAKELHRPVRNKFPTRKTLVSDKDDLWVYDLVDMTKRRIDAGHQYILTVMDVLTRYAWARPLKSKSTVEVASSLTDIFETSGRKPKKLWSDIGPEFTFHVSAIPRVRTRAEAKKINEEILDPFRAQFEKIYTTTTKFRKVWLIERLNRTLKELMWFKFTRAQLREKLNPNKWVKRLPKILNTYNNNVHTGLQVAKKYFVPTESSDLDDYEEYNSIITPKLASETIPTKYLLLILQAQVNRIKELKPYKPKLKVGDQVRIKLNKGTFTKGLEVRWSPEIYTIEEVRTTAPVMYKISKNNQTLKQSFYEEELQKSKFDKDSKIEAYKEKERDRSKQAEVEKAQKRLERVQSLYAQVQSRNPGTQK